MKSFKEFDKWTKELIDQGCTYAEIARVQNRPRCSVREHCLQRGWKSKTNGRKTVKASAIVRLSEQLDAKGYELIDCFGGVDGIVHIKCKVCGGILERKAEVARHKDRILCEHCRQIKHDQEEQERIAKREQLEAERAKRIVYRQQSFKICPECGGIHFDRKKYCSDKCGQKANDRRKDLNRRMRTQSQLVDKDISLSALYKRDHGVCYLCGEQCDWNDYTTKGDVFIAGNHYPSIDHVKPLSKGGEHSWDNVKLACRICNSLKKDNDMMPLVSEA